VIEPIPLSTAEQQALRRQARRAIGRISERIHYVLLFARGHSIEAIAALYEVDGRTVSTWLRRYREGGIGALDDLPRKGRPRLATVAAHTEAYQCLDATPERGGFTRTTWTRRLLGQHLGERLGCWLSSSSVTRLIRRLGFVWARPKLTTKRDDPLASERESSMAAAMAAHPRAPRLFEDECDVHQVPVIRGQYQRRGEQRDVPTPGTNRKQPVFGFLNVLTGQWHYWLPVRKRSMDFLTCLHELYQLYPTGPILLFLDNASIHKSRVTQRWLANHPRFLVCYLPAYSGHRTNPVEKVWWALKAEVMANRMYPNLAALEDAIVTFFASFSRERALRLTAQHQQETRPRGASLALAA
jgi:transposase